MFQAQKQKLSFNFDSEGLPPKYMLEHIQSQGSSFILGKRMAQTQLERMEQKLGSGEQFRHSKGSVVTFHSGFLMRVNKKPFKRNAKLTT